MEFLWTCIHEIWEHKWFCNMFKSPWLNISLLHLVKFYYRKSLCGITEESWRNRMSDPSRLQSFRPVEWWLSPWWICVVVVGGIDTVGVCTKEASMKENWDSWCRLSDFVLTTKKPERFFGAIELIYYWKLPQKSTTASTKLRIRRLCIQKWSTRQTFEAMELNPNSTGIRVLTGGGTSTWC